PHDLLAEVDFRLSASAVSLDGQYAPETPTLMVDAVSGGKARYLDPGHLARGRQPGSVNPKPGRQLDRLGRTTDERRAPGGGRGPGGPPRRLAPAAYTGATGPARVPPLRPLPSDRIVGKVGKEAGWWLMRAGAPGRAGHGARQVQAQPGSGD